MHCSTHAQLAGTLARWFQGRTDLVLLELDADALGAALRWEPGSPGREEEGPFPHVYSAIPIEAILSVAPIA